MRFRILTLRPAIKKEIEIRLKKKFCLFYFSFFKYICIYSGFGGLGVACWPLVPKFAGSNPAEAVGFLRGEKSSARLPSEGK